MYDGFQRVTERDVLRHSVGYAYAGSTTAGMATAIAASVVLSQLGGNPTTPKPTLGDIANVVTRIAWRYHSRLGFALPSSTLDGLVFGFCPHENQPGIYRFDLKDMTLDDPKEAVPVALSDPGHVEVIGSGEPLVRESIAKRRQGLTDGDIKWWAAPYHGVEDAAIAGRRDVGGSLQTVVAAHRGAQAYGAYAEPNGKRLLLGIDLDDAIQSVGEWSPQIPIIQTDVRAKHLDY